MAWSSEPGGRFAHRGHGSGGGPRERGDVMPKASVMVKLSGRWGLPEIQKELSRGPIELELPEDVTGEGFVQRLADRCGPPFARRALKAGGRLRAEVRLFVRNDAIDDPGARIGDKLADGSEISIVLLTPLVGG